MTKILDRIKERVAQRDSPIKTVKAVAEAIGMSEAGFYVMLKRGTTKNRTLLAISNALAVDPAYFSEDSENTSQAKDENFGDDVLNRVMREVHEVRQVFEEQLRAKDRQIDGLQRMLEAVLGKSEGDIVEPLFDNMNQSLGKYKASGLGIALTSLLNTEKPILDVEKLVAPRSQTARTRH